MCNEERSSYTQNTKTRKYQLTINNPVDHGFTHEVIKKILSTFSGIAYWCMCDEIGASGTYHTHVYFYSPNAIFYDTVRERFPGAHVEKVKGSHKDNRDYILKQGKWENDPKHDTNLLETFEESGEMPPERNKRETVSAAILEMIQGGATNGEIILEHPEAMTRTHHIGAARQALRKDKYRNQWRDLHTVYLWGKTGVGKTRGIMEGHGYANVYRVTDYVHPFDDYDGEPVILFEEFRSSLPINDMLKYLDGYPVMLPCRYNNKVACFTEVYIVSNIPLDKQYPNVQIDESKTYEAFLRRIHNVYELNNDLADVPF